MIDYYNDTFLWLSFKKGDKKAFQIILDQYYQNLYNYEI
jgi:hypothetical protein